ELGRPWCSRSMAANFPAVESMAEGNPVVTRLPDALVLGPVHLIVPELGRALAWYQSALGLELQRRNGLVAELGDGSEAVVVLHEDRQAAPPGRHAGLYHFALLYPTREELARAAARLAATGARVSGTADHGTHEAVYLSDVDGIGIELAADRPRDQWPDLREEYVRGPRSLDLDSLRGLIAGVASPTFVGEGLRVGHVHLHVGDIDRAFAFYRDLLGFDERVNMGTAGFVSAGGYHHHLAFNIWRGRDVGPLPDHTIGLRHWTIRLPTDHDVHAARERLAAAGIAVEPLEGGFLARDPWQLAVAVAIGQQVRGER
ncbi:MAG: VOC family protein, partial [Gemmatimonadales bacterium]